MPKEKKSHTDLYFAEKAHHNYVVGIGSSAGGIEALQEIFEHMPADAGFSFVVVQHLATQHKTKLVELLAKTTQLKVALIEDQTPLQENVVHVMPNDKNILLQKGVLRLIEKESKNNLPIDLFFDSLAKDKGDKAIGVILSGAGMDGTKGAKSIKSAGGIVLVQDPHTAQFDGMPQSVISSGQYDYILPPQCIQEEIVACCQPGSKQRTIAETLSDQETTVLVEILDMIKSKTSYDFTYYKRPTILRRLARRMSFLDKNSLSDYLDYISTHQEEIMILCKEFLIGVTRFFRDKDAFLELEHKIVPSIVKAKEFKEAIKVWVTGCSTGEEAYSIAILFKEFFRKTQKEVDVKLFASDIDSEAIDFAIKGVYSNAIEQDVSASRLDRYFIKEGDRYRIHPDIRKMIIFSHHDVLKDVPFGKTDLVSCRNMLIYMDPVLQQKCLSLFHYSLNLGGYLVLGPSENIGELKDSFIEINKRWNIYQNTNPSKGVRVDSVHSLIQKHYSVKETALKTSTQNAFTENLLKVMLDQSNAAGIYIDSSFQIVDTFGKYQKYLRLPEDKLELYLLKMLSKDLSIIVGTSIRKAIKTNEKIEIKDIKIEGSETSFHILIQPFLSDKKFNQTVCLVLFSESKEKKQPVSSQGFQLDPSLNIEHFFALEQELKETKQILQRAIEESETSNEELQSSNEELISANEELQSTNEEMQSVNEELHTVNAENAFRIKEAIELNDDLNNYLRGSDIGQIFLSKDLVIRKFTPSVTTQINLIESDIGRPISHISNNIKTDGLAEGLKKVFESSESFEKEVEMIDGKWYWMKILPYLKAGKTFDGVVITFQEITKLKSLNSQLESVLRNMHAILESSSDGIVACDKNGVITLFNKAMRQFHHLSGESDQPQVWSQYQDLYHPDGRLMSPQETPLYRAFQGEVIKNAEFVIAPRDAERKILLANGQQMVSPNGMLLGAVVAVHDISDQKRSENQLRQLNNELELKIKERTQELQEKNMTLEILNTISKKILSETELSGIVQTVTDAATEITGAQFGAFFYNVVDEKGEAYTLYSISGVPREAFAQFPMPRNTKVFEPTFQGTGIVRVDDITKDPRYGQNTPYHGMPKGHLPVVSYLAVPVVAKSGTVLGGLFFGHSKAGVFTQRIEDLVSAIASQAAVAMNNAALYASTHAAKEELAKINQELSRKNEELESINFDLDNFVYTASHDLKSPVSNIEGLVSALDEIIQEENASKEDIDQYLKLIKESTNRFSNTIKDLTTITKLQKDKDHFFEHVSFENLMTDIHYDIQDLIDSSHAQLLTDFTQCPSMVFSRKKLKSILYNLVSNGIKYRSPDRNPVVTIHTERREKEITISIQDNGLGLSKPQQEKMFSLFKRFHDHVEGTGIGLYIVKRIVDNAGGKIEVESEPHVGSLFRIILKEQEVEDTENK